MQTLDCFFLGGNTFLIKTNKPLFRDVNFDYAEQVSHQI